MTETNKLVYEWTVKMREEEDRFLMETILPYCSRVMQREIKKDDLIAALTMYYARKEVSDESV